MPTIPLRLPLPWLAPPTRRRTARSAPWRSACRLAGFIFLSCWEATEWLLFIALPGRAGSLAARTAWLHRFCCRLVKLFGLEVTCHGAAPRHGLLVGNHVSYLDVVVLAAQRPIAFVSKSEVRDWPGLGPLVTMAGTLFIDRNRRSDVARVGSAVEEALGGGEVVALFPEGTSSDGSAVLPFRSSLFAPACAQGETITPVGLRYRVPGGSAAREVAYWGDMNFGPHFWHLLGQRRIEVEVAFGLSRPAGLDRKAAAHALREEVARLAGTR